MIFYLGFSSHTPDVREFVGKSFLIHFNEKKHSKSYPCHSCGKSFPTSSHHHRHEFKCEAKIKHQYCGGAFRIRVQFLMS